MVLWPMTIVAGAYLCSSRLPGAGGGPLFLETTIAYPFAIGLLGYATG